MTDLSRETAEFAAYERARRHVLKMQQIGSRVGAPSAYWREELEHIDYLIDATPRIVRKLRHHAFHITGIRPYDYRNKGDGRQEHFEARLRALHRLGGDALLVPESPVLGGFGYTIGDQLFNVDTLKFYEVLIGMERGGVLPALRAAARPVVCEVGAGWGGFAYQFKTLLPRALYIILDFPELFLFSATYLAAALPEARLHFVDADDPRAFDGYQDADVVFVPNTLVHLLSDLPADALVNMVSFQEMTEQQVRRYAALAAQRGIPWLYSLNRERSPYNRELESVSRVLGEYYRLADLEILDTDYTSAMKRPPKAGKRGERPESGYRHLVGRLAARSSHTFTDAAPKGGAPTPRVVLGMTLYNRANHLREALDSLLAQTYSEFALLLLDDASTDETERIAREYETRDSRVRYRRHESRAGLIATWREVVEAAAREYPGAEYFAWASDHDRWHPRWLDALVTALDHDSDLVLAYPITRRIDGAGVASEKGPRLFETVAYPDRVRRWMYFCREAVGSGDMVYGLIRLAALRAAGVFRPVLRPDRLLLAELTLAGRIRQVPEVLWFRRESGLPSIARQGHTLLPSDAAPFWFRWPPSWQHVRVLYREYASADPPAHGLTRQTWLRMLVRYQLTYGWRHFRKSEAFHAVNRGIDAVVWTRKITLHYMRHAVYETLMGVRHLRGRIRRWRRQTVYTVLVTMHRLCGRDQTP